MVAVENRDELPFGIFQRIVDVTGFRVFMRGTGDVLYPHFVRELAELGTATVIEDPDFDFILRPVDTQRGVNGVFYHRQVFVVGRHEEVNRRPLGRVFWQRHRLSI